MEEVKFSGNYVEVDFCGLQSDTLLLYRVNFEVPADGEYRVMVSTTANMRCWVDGEFAFGQEAGPFVPAFHRTPLNQRATLKLAKGSHTLLFGVAPLTEEMDSAPLVFVVAGLDNQYIHDAFARKILENN